MALISQEEGTDNLKLVFPGPEVVEDAVTREVDLEGFLRVVAEARDELLSGR